MTLKGNLDALYGVYIDDAGNSCLVLGSGDKQSVSFVIQCETWTANCKGMLSPADVLEGSFHTDLGMTGKYRMVR